METWHGQTPIWPFSTPTRFGPLLAQVQLLPRASQSIMKRQILIAALAVVTLTIVPAPAAADNPLSGLVSEGSNDSSCLGPVELLCGLRDGTVARTLDTVSAVRDDRSAADIADELQRNFNDNSQSFESYANDHLNPGSNSTDTLAVTIKEDGDSETVYVVTDITDGKYTNTSVVDSTSREPDEECTLEDNAARRAPDEIASFHSKYVEPGKAVGQEFVSDKTTRYAGNVDCSFLEENNG